MDCLRGLVPDHLRIIWMDEFFDSTKARNGKAVILKWPNQKVEEFTQVNIAASHYDIPPSYVEKAIKWRTHIHAIPGSPKAFLANDPRVSEMVEDPHKKEVAVFGRKPVRVIYPGGEVKDFESTAEAADAVKMTDKGLSMCIYQNRPNKAGIKFEYIGIKN